MYFSERKTLGPILQAKDSVLLINDLWIVSIFFCLPSHTSIDSPCRHLLRGKTWSWSRWQQVLSEVYTKGSEQVTVKPKLSSGDKVKVAALQTQGGNSESGARETPREKHSKKLCSELCPIQELFTQPRDLKLNGESMSSVRKSLQLPSSKGSKINRINTSWSQLVAHWPAWRRGMPEIASWGCSQPCISRK